MSPYVLRRRRFLAEVMAEQIKTMIDRESGVETVMHPPVRLWDERWAGSDGLAVRKPALPDLTLGNVTRHPTVCKHCPCRLEDAEERRRGECRPCMRARHG